MKLNVCDNQCDYFRRNGKQYRRQHLYQCLDRTRKKGEREKEKEILSIIQQEKDRGFWRRLNYVMGKPCYKLDRRVLVEDKGRRTLIENNTQELVQEEIFDNIHRKRFFLEEAAPIRNSILRGQFGYNNATTKTARKVLGGSCNNPPEFDQATHEICKECAGMRCIIPKNSLDIIIT
jgi:hypothetical protein